MTIPQSPTLQIDIATVDDHVADGYGAATEIYVAYREKPSAETSSAAALQLTRAITTALVNQPVSEAASFVHGINLLMVEVSQTGTTTADEIVQRSVEAYRATLKRKMASADLLEAYRAWRSKYRVSDRIEEGHPLWDRLMEETRPQYLARDAAKQAERNAQRRLERVIARFNQSKP